MTGFTACCESGSSPAKCLIRQTGAGFSEYEWYVVLHLRGGKRLYGWPVLWPNRHDSGHFIFSQPAWFLDDGQVVELPQLERIFVPAEDVTMVEQYKQETPGLSDDEMKAAQEPLVRIHRKEKRHDRRKQSAARNKDRSGPHDGARDRVGQNVGATGERISDADAEGQQSE